MKVRYIQLCLITICAFFCVTILHATKLNLPENHAVNGGVTILPVDLKQRPEVYYQGHRISVLPSLSPKQWLLVVGVPLDIHTSIQTLNMTKPFSATIPFYVSDKLYTTQHLTIENKRKVDPYAQDRARINQESANLKKIFATFSQNNPYKEGFIAPSHGPISSLFGLRRVYNNKPRAPHTGLDIAAKENTPVKVISSGKVADAHNYFFTGNTVIVDHGMGVFSLYAHLKNMNVKPGDTLKQGDQVGTVGMTGRVTGPHLHWSMVINQILVDPLLFVSAHDIRETHGKKRS